MSALFHLTLLLPQPFDNVFYLDSSLSSFSSGYQLRLRPCQNCSFLTCVQCTNLILHRHLQRPKTPCDMSYRIVHKSLQWLRFYPNLIDFPIVQEKKSFFFFKAILEAKISSGTLSFASEVMSHSRNATGEAGILLGWGKIQIRTCKSFRSRIGTHHLVLLILTKERFLHEN